MRGLTFEFTRPAEAGGVSPVCDDATAGTHRAYTACRSGSGVQRVVRPQWVNGSGGKHLGETKIGARTRLRKSLLHFWRQLLEADGACRCSVHRVGNAYDQSVADETCGVWCTRAWR